MTLLSDEELAQLLESCERAEARYERLKREEGVDCAWTLTVRPEVIRALIEEVARGRFDTEVMELLKERVRRLERIVGDVDV